MNQDEHTIKIYQDLTYSKPVKINDISGIYSLSKNFSLDKRDFIVLTKSTNRFSGASYTFLLISISFALKVFSKFVSPYFSNQYPVIESWEWILSIFALILAILLFGIGVFLLNDKKRLIKKIKKYFQQNPSFLGQFKKDE